MVLLILLSSAVCHASWNIIAKGSRDKLTFLWCQIVAASVVLAAPVLLTCPAPDPKGYIFLAISGLMQAAYYFLLAKTYSIGEISSVYPLTRGIAPVIVCIVSAILGTEPITALMIIGALLIFGGIYVINMQKLTLSEFTAPIKALINVPATRLALLNGVMVAAYTLSDKQSVKYTDPLMVYWVIAVIPAILIAPLIIKKGQLKAELSCNKLRILAVSALTFAAYFLVLKAMNFAGAGYVSSVREVSIVFVAIYSAIRFKESFPASKIIGATLIFVGIFLMSI
ncbi:MAG: EamA family transporter [Oscillospiraceae bacterium]